MAREGSRARGRHRIGSARPGVEIEITAIFDGTRVSLLRPIDPA